jgi:hypothetical protein
LTITQTIDLEKLLSLKIGNGVAMSDDHAPLFRVATSPADRPWFRNMATEDAIHAIADLTQAPDTIAMNSIMCSLSVAAQCHADVQTLGGKSPLSLNILTIAKSGVRKSACDMWASRTIEKCQSNRLRDYARKMEIYVERRTPVDVPVIDDADGEVTSRRVTRPINPLIFFNDVTYEATLEHFANGNTSIGIKSDDGGQFFGGHSTKPANRLMLSSPLVLGHF